MNPRILLIPRCVLGPIATVLPEIVKCEVPSSFQQTVFMQKRQQMVSVFRTRHSFFYPKARNLCSRLHLEMFWKLEHTEMHWICLLFKPLRVNQKCTTNPVQSNSGILNTINITGFIIFSLVEN